MSHAGQKVRASTVDYAQVAGSSCWSAQSGPMTINLVTSIVTPWIALRLTGPRIISVKPACEGRSLVGLGSNGLESPPIRCNQREIWSGKSGVHPNPNLLSKSPSCPKHALRDTAASPSTTSIPSRLPPQPPSQSSRISTSSVHPGKPERRQVRDRCPGGVVHP